jgi:hypothetical protein
MPSAERYARYRADQTTIWVSKRAAEFLQREREETGEATAVALDRLLNELRTLRRGGGGGAAKAAKSAGRSAAKGAAKSSARSAAKSGAKSGAKTAGRAGRKAAGRSGTKTAARSRRTA